MGSHSPETAIQRIEEKFSVLNKKTFRGETSLTVKREDIKALCAFCKTTLGFDYLIDLSGADHMGSDPRWEAIYELHSIESGDSLRLKTFAPTEDPTFDSVSDIWPTANWHEREAYDMFGIRFNNHPDLRRILMWDGYPYFPLRKDFPLAGRPSEMPEVAFSNRAPLEGGPFVTSPTTATTKDREPRSRDMR
jgi:NADH-quinone oxidoreductase subunit C